MALIYIMNNICGECNISSENFNNSNLDYSASGHTLFSTDIIYSNLNGTITSTTLIHRLQTWILPQSSPNLIAGKVLLIDKHCPTRVYAATISACISKKMAISISPITYGGFAIGLFIGAFGASAVAVVIVTVW